MTTPFCRPALVLHLGQEFNFISAEFVHDVRAAGGHDGTAYPAKFLADVISLPPVRLLEVIGELVPRRHRRVILWSPTSLTGYVFAVYRLSDRFLRVGW
jgi:hypothetical protein